MRNRKATESITVDDVAADAGVSIKTVSRVLNHEPNVSEQTRLKVAASIARLGYRPNPAARGLASRRTNIIALVYDNPSDNYIVNLQRGALEACSVYDYSLLLSPCDYHSPDLAAQLAQSARQHALAGMILSPPVGDVKGLARTLDEIGVHYVRLAPADPERKGLSVSCDDRSAARDMTLYLAGLGHRRIGFITGHTDHASAHERLAGYREAMQQSGLPVDEHLIEHGTHTFESGVACGRRLLARSPRPTAIFASNDDMAAGVLYAAHAQGIDVPGALSVAGYDDTPLSRQVWPSLTTVRQPIQGMAYAAVEQIVAVQRPQHPGLQHHPQRETLEYELIVRDSTRAPAA